MKIAVSQCLLGDPVRYNGEGKLSTEVKTFIVPMFEILSFCPEVGAGMKIPRPAINVVRGKDGDQILEVESRINHTALLEKYSQLLIEKFTKAKVCGVVIKSKSPSCGYNTTPIYNESMKEIEMGSGFFSKHLHLVISQIPIIDEVDLQNKQMREEFLARVSTYSKNLEGASWILPQ